MNEHLLATLVALPLVAALLVLCVPRGLVGLVRPIAGFATLVDLVLAYRLLDGNYERGRAPFSESYGWIWDAGISLSMAVDGLSLPLVLLTVVITPIALLATFPTQVERAKPWAAGMLVLESALIGAFVARDLFFFYVCWELVLLPLYLFIGVWGSGGKSLTANKFFLYTFAGSVLMLVAVLYAGVTYASHSPHPSFLASDLERLVMPLSAQAFCFAAFALAFGIKMPLFPLHSWSPDTYRDAPLGAGIMAAAVLAKLGSYGLVRFAMPIFPLGSQYVGPSIAVLAVAGILYGALAAWRQNDARALIAYSSMSHMGFIVLGLFAMTPVALAGSVLQMVSHGLTTAGLFLVVAAVESRSGTREIAGFGGLATPTPKLATAFVMVALAAVAIPMTSGFVGETMILSGTFASSEQVGFGSYGRYFAATGALGVVLGAIYILALVQKAIWGETNERTKEATDLGRGEVLAVAPLIVLTFALGLAPSFLLDRIMPAAQQAILSFDMRWGASREAEESYVVAPAPAEGAAAAQGDDADPPARPTVRLPRAPGGDGHEGHGHGPGGHEGHGAAPADPHGGHTP